MAVYSYSRTSEIESLESQGNIDAVIEMEDLRLQTYALSQGMRITSSFVDANQKWSEDFATRSQAITLNNTLESGDIILACSLERVFSSCEDMSKTLADLKKRKVKLIVIELGADLTAKDFSPLFSNLLKIFHKLEKRRSTERIKTVKQNQRNKGRFLGGSRPFGYMVHSNGRLIENPVEQRVLKKIIQLKKSGMSLRAISSKVSTPMVPVSFKTVQRLLKRNESQLSA